MSRILVVGDCLLDHDIVGRADRLCPDWPAPVVEVDHERWRAGGAGLGAVELARAGHQVELVTALGDDEPGDRLRALLAADGVHVVATRSVDGTRVKSRVRSRGTVVRLDRGAQCRPADMDPTLTEHLMTADAVLVSDYAGGVLEHTGVRAALGTVARTRPVVWDPHPRGAAPVPGVRLATPNQQEASRLAGLDGRTLGDARRAAAELQRRWGASAVAVTLGERGALLSYGDTPPLLVPCPSPSAHGDTCGAGDAFAAAATSALASGELIADAVAAAVAAASRFVSAAPSPGRGAHPDSLDAVVASVRSGGGTVVATGGCFDLLHAGHVRLLSAARDLGDCLVVLVNSDDSARRLKGPGRPVVPGEDRAEVLRSLASVDAVVIFDEDDPTAALARIRPDVWVKGGDYGGAPLPESALVESWGGEVVLLPYLDGRSSSGMIRHSMRAVV